MTKRDIVIEVTKRVGLSQKQVKAVFELCLETIVNALAKGDKIEIRDFGVFKAKGRKPRMGRNPRTGEPVSIASKRVVHFKPGKALKEMVDKG